MEYTPEIIEAMKGTITIEGVRAARDPIAPYLNRTPLLSHPLLNEATGLDLYVKHENHLPTGAFKVRGGYNLISQLSDDEKKVGVIAATRVESWAVYCDCCSGVWSTCGYCCAAWE
jgi:threonine synthase